MNYYFENKEDAVMFIVFSVPNESLELVADTLVPKIIADIPVLSWEYDLENFKFNIGKDDAIRTHRVLTRQGFRSSAFWSKWENVKDLYAATYNESEDSEDSKDIGDFDCVLVPSIVYDWDWDVEPEE